MPPSPVDLQYAPPPKWYQKRSFQRLLWLALPVVLSPFIVAGGWLACDYLYDAWKVRENRRLLAACESYLAPSDQTVFSMESGVVTQRVVAPPWLAWWSTTTWSYPTVFMHRRTDAAPTGLTSPSHLVVTEIEPRLMHTYDGGTVLDRPVLCFDSKQVWGVSARSAAGVSGSTKLVILPEPEDRVRVFAGRASADDPASFSFEVEYNGRRQTVRGWLNGGLVELKPDAGEVLRPDEWRHAVFWLPEGATSAMRERTRAVAASAGAPSPLAWALPAWWLAPAQPVAPATQPR